jgi:hypothetical protein
LFTVHQLKIQLLIPFVNSLDFWLKGLVISFIDQFKVLVLVTGYQFLLFFLEKKLFSFFILQNDELEQEDLNVPKKDKLIKTIKLFS